VDRILVESDQCTAVLMEDEIVDMCRIVSEAKGWSLEETASKTYSNSMTAFQLEND
jgi:Tat protein secretion system quality control protein TatD with DNase activity